MKKSNKTSMAKNMGPIRDSQALSWFYYHLEISVFNEYLVIN